MENTHITQIASVLTIRTVQVEKTLELLESGATIPFISRYRKEMTGNLDEVQIQEIRDQHGKLVDLQQRREAVTESIEQQGKMTDALKKQIEACVSMTELEDLYLPYKPKKKTKASVAKANGLEPLANKIQLQQQFDVDAEAGKYLSENVASVADALQGARDIIAERLNEDASARNKVRHYFERYAQLQSKVVKTKKEEAIKYQDYFEWTEDLSKCPSHRLLAIFRGAKEGFLRVSISPDDDVVTERLQDWYAKNNTPAADVVRAAVADGYKRLLKPSIENEFAGLAKEKADKEAIAVFAENLRQLLLGAPLGEKRILAIDPGYRTGCKVVCLDSSGQLLHNETIYPHQPQNQRDVASKKITHLLKSYNIETIAIGNGTAGRETEQFIRNQVFVPKGITIFSVNENGASVYSASKIARDEFPDYDVTVRGAVSIGRRLMDPLAELVKIDPKSIGVGQYQHDVNQKLLKETLDNVVVSCVNKVGVNLNTASEHLLRYVSGLSAQLATNIVAYRTENGAFTSRQELLKVARLGPKAFEQSAGFLRIRNAKNPLDNSAVHPERYGLIKQIVRDLDTTVDELVKNADLRKKIDWKKYVDSETGMLTLNDIRAELEKPGRDPREQLVAFQFDPRISKIDDLDEGMVVPGLVTNITNFGAFVDIGVKQDGLVHISMLKNAFVKNPADVVHLNQQVRVKIMEVDKARKRIQLSMKDAE